MLSSLYIKNYALIEEINIEFHPGLNIITGETGAGKSILIDAVSMALGERASVEAVRSGTDRAIIEARFDISRADFIKSVLSEREIEYSEELTLRREISVKGSSRSFINDMLVTNSVLKEVGDYLVDLHGQHEHQALLKTERHIDYLDGYCRHTADLSALRASYQAISRLLKARQELIRQNEAAKERADWYSAQLKEIQSVNPEIDEEDNLRREEKILAGSEKLYRIAGQLHNALYNDEQAVLGQLTKMEKSLLEISAIDDRLQEITENFKTAQIQLEEIARWIGDYQRRIHFDPLRLETINARLQKIQHLKKKYGSVAAALEKKAELEGYLRTTENFESEIGNINRQLEQEISNYSDLSVKISERRKTLSRQLEKNVVGVMKQLGMEHAVFEVRLTVEDDPQSFLTIGGKNVRTTAKGTDQVEFLLSANPGEAVKPLAKVASGGEISRIMLSLKSVLAEADEVCTLIFDEIDVGISGRIAQAVGNALYELAQKRQTICITHLPQIAARSDYHYSVIKMHQDGKTVTQIRSLGPSDKVRDVARLLGGETVTDTAIKNAEELIRQK